MVAGEDKEILGIVAVDEIDVLGNSIRSSAENFQTGISFLTRSQDENAAVLCVKAPKAALCNITVQEYRFILCQNADNIDAAVGAVTEGEIDDAVFSTVLLTFQFVS